MSTRGGEFVAADESTVVAKPFLDPIVVEDSQSDGCLANPTGTNESYGCEVYCQFDDLFD